jgi:hypothetical protein
VVEVASLLRDQLHMGLLLVVAQPILVQEIKGSSPQQQAMPLQV